MLENVLEERTAIHVMYHCGCILHLFGQDSRDVWYHRAPKFLPQFMYHHFHDKYWLDFSGVHHWLHLTKLCFRRIGVLPLVLINRWNFGYTSRDHHSTDHLKWTRAIGVFLDHLLALHCASCSPISNSVLPTSLQEWCLEWAERMVLILSFVHCCCYYLEVISISLRPKCATLSFLSNTYISWEKFLASFYSRVDDSSNSLQWR
jgi:hypothetical protein